MSDDSVIKLIDQVRLNPMDIQNTIIDKVHAAYNGEEFLVDPTNPLVMLLEANAVTGAAAMSHTESATRALYPELAVEPAELYRHMSDNDYNGRFALPGSTVVEFWLNRDEIIAKAVLDVATGYRKMVMPKDSSVVVGGYRMGIHYPIEIRVLPSDALQIVYDGTTESPLAALETNTVDWEEIKLEGQTFVRIFVPMYQFVLTPTYEAISSSAGTIHRVPFNDQFYYARVYYGSVARGWTEMRTTHSDQVYDPLDPTALLKVVEQTLEVEVPHIYLTSNQLFGQLRIDIYTTLGDVEVIMSDFLSSSFGVDWTDHDNVDNGVYTTPLTTLATLGILSTTTLRGGSNGISFEELRRRVVTSGSNEPIPITDTQLENALLDRGYTMLKRLDNITDRAYQMTRELPAPQHEDVSASIGSITEVIEVNMDELSQQSTIIDNRNRITIEPNTLYRIDRGLVKVVSDDERTQLLAMTPDQQITELNANEYLYTPFHYVLDFNEQLLEVRPYYLNAPKIESKRHVAENVNILALTQSSSIGVEKTTTGYRVVLEVSRANIEDEIDISQLTVQMSFMPDDEVQRAYLNGTLIGTTDESFVYEFLIESTFDLDENGNLSVSNFRLYEDDIQTYYTPLTTEFSIFFTISNYPILVSQRTEIDQRMGQVILPNGSVGNSEEAVVIKFGESLDGLRNDSRTVASTIEYERYAAAVPAVYETNVYQRDGDGNIVFTIDPDTNRPTYTVLHAKGDPVLDGLGEPVMKHNVGDVKLDPNGEPITKVGRKLNRQFAIILFDARYLFAGDPEIVSYVDGIPDTIIGYLENDVRVMSERLLERTSMKFAPRRTMGNINVTEKDGKVITIPSAQRFTINYYLTGTGYRDSALRLVLSNMTNEVISRVLSSNTVTVNDIEKALMDEGGSEVVTVECSGLGNADLQVYTVVDQSAVSSLATKLEINAAGVISLSDDVTVNFLRHGS